MSLLNQFSLTFTATIFLASCAIALKKMIDQSQRQTQEVVLTVSESHS